MPEGIKEQALAITLQSSWWLWWWWWWCIYFLCPYAELVKDKVSELKMASILEFVMQFKRFLRTVLTFHCRSHKCAAFHVFEESTSQAYW